MDTLSKDVVADLLSKALALVHDPSLVAVLVSFGLTLLLIWKLFDKQYEFVKARLDMLLKENEDLRKHIDVFRQENERLRQSTQMISIVVEDLKSQPEEIRRQLKGVESLTSELARGLASREDRVAELRSWLDAVLSSQNESARTTAQAISRLESALTNLGLNRDVALILNDAIRVLRETQARSLTSLDAVGRRLESLLEGNS